MNLSLFKVFMSEDVIEPVNKVLMSGQLTQGAKVEEFETKLKEYINWQYEECRLVTKAQQNLPFH